MRCTADYGSKCPCRLFGVALGNQLLHVLLRWVKGIGTEGTFHASERIFLVASTAHEHQRTEDNQQENDTANNEHCSVKTTGYTVAAVGGLGVVRPLTRGWVVGPFAAPLTVTVGVEDEFASSFDGLRVCSRP